MHPELHEVTNENSTNVVTHNVVFNGRKVDLAGVYLLQNCIGSYYRFIRQKLHELVDADNQRKLHAYLCELTGKALPHSRAVLIGSEAGSGGRYGRENFILFDDIRVFTPPPTNSPTDMVFTQPAVIPPAAALLIHSPSIQRWDEFARIYHQMHDRITQLR